MLTEIYYWHQAGEFESVTYKVKQEVPADCIILDQMGCDVCGSVGGKGHQEIRSCYCQGATYDRKRAEGGETLVKRFLYWFDRPIDSCSPSELKCTHNLNVTVVSLFVPFNYHLVHLL